MINYACIINYLLKVKIDNVLIKSKLFVTMQCFAALIPAIAPTSQKEEGKFLFSLILDMNGTIALMLCCE